MPVADLDPDIDWVDPEDVPELLRTTRALRARVAELEAVLAAQEQALNFETTCLGCGSAWENALRETLRAERAERALRRVRALHRRAASITTEYCTACSERVDDEWRRLVSYPCPTLRALDAPVPPAQPLDPDAAVRAAVGNARLAGHELPPDTVALLGPGRPRRGVRGRRGAGHHRPAPEAGTVTADLSIPTGLTRRREHVGRTERFAIPRSPGPRALHVGHLVAIEITDDAAHRQFGTGYWSAGERVWGSGFGTHVVEVLAEDSRGWWATHNGLRNVLVRPEDLLGAHDTGPA